MDSEQFRGFVTLVVSSPAQQTPKLISWSRVDFLREFGTDANSVATRILDAVSCNDEHELHACWGLPAIPAAFSWISAGSIALRMVDRAQNDGT